MTSAPRPDPGSAMIDWDLAVRVGSRLAGDGPVVSRAEATRSSPSCAPEPTQSTPLVREFTGLVAEDRTAPVLVVDRPGWIQANADGFATGHRADRRQAAGEEGAAVGRWPRRSARGSPVPRSALMLGFLGNKVLGQFDPFYSAPGAAGRLLLVAPEHRARRARARRRRARLPALGLPARGDPPGPVHRGAVDARPPPLLDGRRSSDAVETDPAALLSEGRLPGRRRGLRQDRRQPARPVLDARSRSESSTRSPG